MRALSTFRLILIGLLVSEGLLAILLGPGKMTGVAAEENAARRPVLVELFTSEGCSSCPPADALLAKLDAAQPIAGAQVIVLSEHVTYWNQQGWHDPFSLDAMTDRQKQYGDRFGLSDVFTPQAVVDGAAQMVGSDERGLEQAVERAAASPKEELSIGDAQWAGKAVHFTVKRGDGAGGAKDSKQMLVAALADDSAQSSVARGENAGRSLRHVSVVRVMQEMGRDADDGRPLTLKGPSGNQTGPMRLVVFLADRHNGHVMAVAERTISR
jgi:hypothetical protein